MRPFFSAPLRELRHSAFAEGIHLRIFVDAPTPAILLNDAAWTRQPSRRAVNPLSTPARCRAIVLPHPGTFQLIFAIVFHVRNVVLFILRWVIYWIALMYAVAAVERHRHMQLELSEGAAVQDGPRQ